MRNFDYSPGLPGYGTRGVDGSIGFAGLATYFSSYNGNSDSVSIKAKIIANKLLLPTDELLPGYPTRIYQTGDVFIDKNGSVFKIDLATSNLYVATGQQLNTTGFFESGPSTTSTPVYGRFSNAFATSKFLIDSVYVSSNVGNYTANPTSIYGIPALNYGYINFTQNGINSYQPIAVYSSSTDPAHPERAIALVKEETHNVWHLGNLDGTGTLRDTSLFLDFKDIITNGVIHGNVQGSITSINLDLPGWLHVAGDTSLNNVYVKNTIDVSNGTRISSNSIDYYGAGSDFYVNTSPVGTGNVHMGTSVGTIYMNNDLYVEHDVSIKNHTKLNTLTVHNLLTADTSLIVGSTLTVGAGTKITNNGIDYPGGGSDFYVNTSSLGTGNVHLGTGTGMVFMNNDLFVIHDVSIKNHTKLNTLTVHNLLTADTSLIVGSTLTVGAGTKITNNYIGRDDLGSDFYINTTVDGTGNVHIGSDIGSVRMYNDLFVEHDASVKYNTSLNTLSVYGLSYFTGRLTAVNDAQVNNTLYTNNLIVQGDVSTLSIKGPTTFYEDVSIIKNIYAGLISVPQSRVGGGGVITQDYTTSTRSITLQTGNVNGTPSLYLGSGSISLITGNAGNAGNAYDGGDPGYILINPGDGGNSGVNPGDGMGSDGGHILCYGGEGGQNSGNGSPGNGGYVSIHGGLGGAGGTIASGDGGNVLIYGGTAGTTSYGEGVGGYVAIYGGARTGADNNVYISCNYSTATKGHAVFSNGTVGAPGIVFHGDVNTGFWHDTTDVINVSTAGAKHFMFDSAGSFYAYSDIVAYYTSMSDIRLKENIKKLENPLNKILLLNAVSYSRTDTKEKHIGYIAQEVEQIMPDVVTETGSFQLNNEKYKGIRYQEIIPYLSEAIKEQQKMIKEQQKTIDYLAKQIEKIINK
jgi:hypothetical protein